MKLRRVSQVVSLLIFILTVIQVTSPYDPLIPSGLFIWIDPLAGIGTQISSRLFDTNFLLSLIVLLSPLIVGRAFCGWVCPMGTVIDVSDHFISPKSEKSNLRRYRSLKTVLLLIFILLATLGIQYSWFLDPIPIIWRSFGLIFIPLIFLVVNSVLSSIAYIGILPNTISNIQDNFLSYLFPSSTPDISTLLVPLLMIVTILLLGKLSRRFWCRNLCPLGALLGIISKLSPLQRVVNRDKCTECGKCKSDCKMDAIEEDFFTTEKSECIVCLNCIDSCSPDATAFRLRPFGKMSSSIDISRRSFIRSIIIFIAGAFYFSVNKPYPTATDRVIRPPGSITEDQFLEKCIRCGECVKVCSSTGNCLQMSSLEGGLEGLWTPIAKFRYGYCEYNCNLCGQVCPTKAIQPLSLEEKKRTPMGVAIILKDRCIPYRLNENCIVCEEHCPTTEKAIKFEKKSFFDVKSNELRIVNYPYVDPELCIGCGICENKCPLEGEAGIIVIKEGEQRIAV